MDWLHCIEASAGIYEYKTWWGKAPTDTYDSLQYLSSSLEEYLLTTLDGFCYCYGSQHACLKMTYK
jgi:hypothetical protein